MPELPDSHSDCGDSGEILKAMRERGLTIIEAIKASMQIFGIGLGDAKSLVSAHPSWNQEAETAGPFHDELIQVLQDANDDCL